MPLLIENIFVANIFIILETQ